MARQVSNFDDLIDSRDVIAYIAELERLLEDVPADEADLYDEERDTLAALKALAEDASSSQDWTYGETLIRDSYFEQYAEDLGLIDRNVQWPHTCIDWEAAADALQMVYTAVDFDGVTYWIRA